MALAHIASGEVVHVGPLGAALAQARTTALLKSSQLEVARVVLAAGKSMREHAAPGEVTLQCIEGEVQCSLGNATACTLRAGDFVHLGAGEPHALQALQDSSLLVTMVVKSALPASAVANGA